ncbi:uncharacterized protein LOC121921360 isoform X3 [Sceloporus undulatus]|uniref:uncharacterized protein LOC121921360 isoform X3 n=1 Tax=Sceloporus undulatus TaxID=8520 RepID=UPI001C4B1B70|nr:uncharacterized protein LOC121921360 isoform X3 [Sceloporus undulatus]
MGGPHAVSPLDGSSSERSIIGAHISSHLASPSSFKILLIHSTPFILSLLKKASLIEAQVGIFVTKKGLYLSQILKSDLLI